MSYDIHHTGFLPPLSEAGKAHAHRDVEARSHDDSARRGAIWHATAGVADELLRGDDLRPYYDDHERLSRLFQAVGDVTTDILDNSCLDLDAALVRLVAEGQLWLEARSREAATR